MGIIEAFDNTSEEILKPSHFAKKVEGFPEIVIVTFRKEILDILVNNYETQIISTFHAGMEVPIYKMNYKGKEIAFYMTWIGAPVTVGILEEIVVKGGKKFLLFGSSGSLDRNITDGHIIVPTFAYRDEGTSYHYVPAEAGDFIEIKTANHLLEIFSDIGIPVTAGRTWTTDAVFRETFRNRELRKEAGCITVEMECASVMAMAQFRKVDIYYFLYTADNLDCKEWESRLLENMPQGMFEKYVHIALEVSIRL